MSASPRVTHNAAASQFELRTNGGFALLRYVARGDTLDLTHTEVPPADQGQGLGETLVRGALELVAAQKKRVVPSCPFVRAYIDKHPEHAGLVATP
jgi:predicted GNAT family acetyltransferase